MSISWEGVKEFKAKLASMRKKEAPNGYKKALIKVMLMVEAESIRRAPIDTGNLRRSGAGNATVTSSGQEGATGVTFFTANYAIFVHEMTQIAHVTGESKFLQNAILGVKPFMSSVMGKTIMASIHGPGGKK